MKLQRLPGLVLAFCTSCTGSLEPPFDTGSQTQPVFANTLAAGAPRLLQPSTWSTCALMPDGRLLLFAAGGGQVYDPATGSVHAVAAPTGGPLAVLKDGRVLVAEGGRTTSFFDPLTELRTPGPDLRLPRSAGVLVPLRAGGAMYIGGNEASPTNEVLDPDGGAWTFAADSLAVPRTWLGFTHLGPPDRDTFYVAGGFTTDGGSTASIERLDPQFGWLDAGTADLPMYGMLVAPTPTGGGVVFGGWRSMLGGSTTVSVELPSGSRVGSPGINGLFYATAGWSGQTGGIVPSGRLVVGGGNMIWNIGGTLGDGPNAYAFQWDGGSGWYPRMADTFALPGRRDECAALMANGRLLWAGGNTNNATGNDTFELYDEYGPALVERPPLPAGRGWHSATLLPSGKVLLAGGAASGVPGAAALGETLLLEVGGGTPGVGPALLTPRARHTATLLRDGTVLLVGGESAGGVLRETELVGLDASTPLPPLATPRVRHSATLLADGTVLVVGGTNDAGLSLASTERFDPATRTWHPGPTLAEARHAHAATLLPSGTLVVAAGLNVTAANGPYMAASLELLAADAGSFTSRSTSPGFQRFQAAATMAPGAVLVLAGGSTLTAPGVTLASAPTATVVTWNGRDGGLGTLANLPAALEEGLAQVLPDGRLLVAGGRTTLGSTTAIATYDPEVKTWGTHSPLPTAYRTGATATLLPDNRLRLAGGLDGVTPVAEVTDYDEGRNAVPAWVPVITGIDRPVAPGATALLHGLTLMGGQWALNGNFSTAPAPTPIVTLERLDGTMRLAAVARDWSETSLRMLVPAVSEGWYLVRVTTNGIASAGVPVLVTQSADAGTPDAGVDAGSGGGGTGAGGGGAGAGAGGGGAAGGAGGGGGGSAGGGGGGTAPDAGDGTDGGVTAGPGLYGCLCGSSGSPGSGMLFLGAAFFAFAARRRRGLGAGGVLAVLVMALGAGGALAQTAPAVDPGLPKAKSARPAKAKAPAKKKPAPKDTSATATPASAAPEAAMPVRVDSAPAPAPAVPPASVEAARPASAPRREGQRTKVAVLPLECGPGVQKELAAVITDAIASALAERKELEVTSARDVAARLGFERQRAVLGVSNCADDLQCMVEIGNALGVDKIAFGSVARLGSSAVLSTTVVRLQGSDVVRHTERVKALTEEGFLDAIPPTVDALFPRAAASGVAGEAAGEVNGGPSELDGTRLALTVRGQMAPLNLPLGAIVAHLDWSFSEAWSAGVGAIIARPFGVMARGTWVPFNASGRVRPLVSLEVPVLFASSPAVGVGAALGFEWRIVRNLAVGLEVPVSYYLLAPDGTQRLWLFGAVTLTGRL